VSSDAKPVLDQLSLVARDVDAMVAFYRRLGLTIPDEAIWQTDTGPHHASAVMPDGLDFDIDSAALAAAYNAGWSSRGDGNARIVVGFKVVSREAVDVTYDDLTGAGYAGRQPPYDTFFGARYAIVADPDGNDVGIMSPPDPARRTAPPAI
jgi:catechol 2,3-dioxygenase-like lactoylglutathione lyase family enzyme